MNNTSWLLQLRRHLPAQDWPWVTQALRQDVNIWRNLVSSPLGQFAIAALPTDGSGWSPAQLALFDNPDLLPLSQWQAESWSKLDDNGALEAKDSFIAMQEDKGTSFLSAYGMAALHLRQKRCIESSWEFLLDEIRDTPIDLDHWKTICACLFGMIPESKALLDCLSKEHPALALHTVLCNPLPAQALEDYLNDWISTLATPVQTDILQLLTIWRPPLAKQLAIYLSDKSPSPNAESDYTPDIHELVSRLSQLNQRILISQNADQVQSTLSHLNTAQSVVRDIQACLAANQAKIYDRIAHAQIDEDLIESTEDFSMQASLESWELARHLAPMRQDILSANAIAMVDAGNPSGALEILKPHLDSFTTTYDRDQSPALFTAAAIAYAGSNDLENTASYAKLALIASQQDPHQACSLSRLADLLLLVKAPALAIQAAQLALSKEGPRPHPLAVLCQSNLLLEQYDEALENALEIVSLEPSSEDAQALLIQTLEEAELWPEALTELADLHQKLGEVTADDYHELAECAIHARDIEQAAQACHAALQINSEDSQAYLQLGKIAIDLGDHPAAAHHLQHSIQLDQNCSASWILLSTELKELGEEEQALDTLRTGSQAASDDARIHLALGKSLLERELLAQALDPLKRAHSIAFSRQVSGTLPRHETPRSWRRLQQETSSALGHTLFELGKADEACQVYEMIGDILIDKMLDNPELLHGYAQSLMATGRTESALPLLDKVLLLQPDNSRAYLDTARALMSTAPSNPAPEAAYHRTVMLLQQKLPPLELDNNEDNPSQDRDSEYLPEDEIPEGYALLAEALQATGEYAGAEAAYRYAMKSQLIQQPEWRFRLASGMGDVAMQLGQPETALAALLEATLLMPSESQLYRQLSEAYQSLDLAKEAHDAALRYIELAPGDVAALTWYARQCQELELLASNSNNQLARSASNALQQAVQIAPSNGHLWMLLGQATAHSGDRDGAIEIYSILTGETSSQLILAHPGSEDISAIGIEINFTSEDLREAAKSLIDLDDAKRAITLYTAALQLVEPGNQETVATTVNLLSELAHAYRLSGELLQAIETIDKAITLEPTNAELYTNKAALLLDTDDRIQAMECLCKAADTNPDDKLIYLQISLVAQALGDQPYAYLNATKATQNNPGQDNQGQIPIARWLAAEMALAMQEQDIALAALANNNELSYEGACLLAELSLEAGLDEQSARALTLVIELAPHHPRSLAIQSRFIARQDGLNEGSSELLHTALQNRDYLQSPEARPERTQDPHFKSTWYPLEIDRLAAAAGMRSLSTAAMEHGKWKPAMALADSACQYSPLLPSSQFQVIAVVVARAENQWLCQKLSIITHAPGLAALSGDAEERLTNALQNIQQITVNWRPQTSPDLLALDYSRIKMALDRWLARGQAVFHPSDQSASALMQALATTNNNFHEIAALVACQFESGDARSAWRSAQDHLQFSNVALAAGIALAALEPSRARDLARQSIERLGKPEWRLLEAAPRFHALLAIILSLNPQQKDEIQIALTAWKNTLGFWDNEPRWHSATARLFIQLAVMEDSEHDYVKLAIDHQQKAVEFEPSNPQLYLALGQTYILAGDSTRAIQALEQVTRLAPQTGDAWLLLANIQKSNGLLDKAIDSADQAVEFCCEPIDALLLRAKLSLETNNPRGAYNRVESALAINPDHPQALYLLALAAQAMNLPTEALSAIDRALELPNPALDAYLLKIQILRQVKGPQIALQAAQQLNELFPNQPRVLVALASLLLENGRGDDAMKSARAALQFNEGELPASQEAHLNLLIGQQMRHSGQLDQAIHHLSEAIRKSSIEMDAYIELGRSYQDRRQIAQAMEVYQKAAKFAPNDYRPYYQAGLAYKESRDYMEAETMLRRAAHLAPNDVSIHRQLAAVVALNLVHNRRLAPSD